MWIENLIWFGCAGLGFAILFNVPIRTLSLIFCLAALGGITKLLLLQSGAGLIFASLGGASIVGILSIQAAHYKHSPHIVFSIPSVIPMVPGVFAYRMINGLVKLVSKPAAEMDPKILTETVQNGLLVAFISLALAIGVAIPFLITRKNSAKLIQFKL